MDLKDYWRIFQARWIAIVAFTLVGTLIGIGWAMLQTKVYSSTASGILSAGVNTDIGTAAAAENYSKLRVKSYLDIAKSTTVANLAADELSLDISAGALLPRISISNPSDTATIKVTAEAETPEKARDLAEAWIKAIGAQVNILENVTVDENTENEKSIVAFRSLDSASLSSSPVSPNSELATMLGLIVGAALGIAYSLLRNIFDRRVQSAEGIEKETGMAAVGVLPHYKGFTDDSRMLETHGGNDRGDKSREEYEIAEALRELRTNLQFMNIDNPPRKIVVTSALPAEGKSTLIANLASTIAASGQQVVVIDGDLRRPMIAKIFGLLEGVGLTDVLIGRASLADVSQPWGPTGNLHVLGAGKIPPNPSELLASDKLQNIINELAEHAIVLIDAPPLLPVTDAAILTARTDGALIVARANRTTYDEVKASIDTLGKINAHVLGIIVNGISTKTKSSDGYGYRYRAYYDRVGDPATGEIPVSDVEEFEETRKGRRAAG